MSRYVVSRWAFVLGLLTGSMGGSLLAQVNPNGWIQTNGWNLLFPLYQPRGCDGSGESNLAKNWIPPHNIGEEDPKAGDVWSDIDFAGDAIVTAWGAEGLFPSPTWITKEYLEGLFPAAVIPNGDGVDYTALVNGINGTIIPTLPGWPPGLLSEAVLGIATTYVRNKTAAPLEVEICTASDDSLQVWVNDAIVTNVSSCRGWGTGECQETRRAFLPVGVSKISTLTWQGGGGWGFRLALQIGGTKLKDGDSRVTFLGSAGGPGQRQYSVRRAETGRPAFGCPGIQEATIGLKGKGPGAAGDLLTVEETVLIDPGLGMTPGSNLVISNVSNGGVVSDLLSPDRYEPNLNEILENTFVGFDCLGGSNSWYEAGTETYTSSSTSGGDIWDGGDDFEFMYSPAIGDFDLAIEILNYFHWTGQGRWGKFGLMARENLDRCSRYTMVQGHGPSDFDPARQAGRVESGICTGMYEWLFQGVGARPRFLRLTRRGNVVQGFVSNLPGLADGSANPYNDANWVTVGGDDWGWAAPPEMLVGFANSEHNSEGCTVQLVQFRILHRSVAPQPVLGKKIRWQNVARSAVTTGLSYKVSTPDRLRTHHSGLVVGQTVVEDIERSFDFADVPSTGPVGIFDDSHDIGNPPTRGSTFYNPGSAEYSVTGSGADIWDGGDDFQFAYKEMQGDFIATAAVVARPTNPEGYPWGRYGIMTRWSCARNAKFSMIEATFPTGTAPPEAPRHHFRLYDGLASSNRDYYIVDDGLFPIQGRSPTWMRLVRMGNTIYSYLAENHDGQPGTWQLIGSDSAPEVPSTLLVGLAVQGRVQTGATVVFRNVSIEAWNPCFEFTPIGYETSSSGTAGLGSIPHKPIFVTALVPPDADRARATGGSGLGVKNRNWIWRDLTIGSEDLTGTRQLLWNNENRNAEVSLRLRFDSQARVYIAWDSRHVKGGIDNPNGTVTNGWFDFNNAVWTKNAQGWLRIGESSAVNPDADVIEVNPAAEGGDDFFAQGGVWQKDVTPDTTLEFRSTGFATARTPYVVFVKCGGTPGKDEPGANVTFSQPDGQLPASATVVQEGSYQPAVYGGRLRLTQEGIGGSSNAVWYQIIGMAPLDEQGFYAEFDVFMKRTGLGVDRNANPADGITFAIVQGVGSDPFLNAATLLGGGGGGLGFDGGALRARTEGHPNFAIEMDTWIWGGEPGNEPQDAGSPMFDGKYHLGVDVGASVSSIQTNSNLNVTTEGLPDIFSPAGIHAEVRYLPEGHLEAWVSANDGSVLRRKVLSTRIPTFEGDFLLGFTGATGGASCTAEVDNLKIGALCWGFAAPIAVSGPASAVTKTTAVLTAVAMQGATLTYSWQLVRGSATLGPTNQKNLSVRSDVPGEVVVRVTAGTGLCGESSSAERSISFTCPTQGDTHCTALTVSPPTGKPGTYRATATASDDNGEPIQYTFTASNGIDPPIVIGPQAGNSANFNLGAGDWTVTAFADDDPNCPDEAPNARRSTTVKVTPASCNLTLTCALNAGSRTVRIAATPAGPGGCNCDEVIVRRGGTEIYRGPLPGGSGDFPLPPSCDPRDSILYEAACLGPGGEGTFASCSVVCPDEFGDPIAVRSLQLDVPATAILTGTSRRAWYQLTAHQAVGKTVVLTVTDTTPADANSLYLRWGELPTSSLFDRAATGPQPSQRLVETHFQDRSLFLMVQADRFGGGSNGVTVLARLEEMSLQEMSPSRTGRDGLGLLDAVVLGSGFTSNTAFTLKRPGGATFPATGAKIASSTRAEVTFHLAGAPVGQYELSATTPSATAKLERAFEVTDTRLGAIFKARVIPMPLEFPYPAGLTLEYWNEGDEPMPAPLLLLKLTVPPKTVHFFLKDEENFEEGSIQLIAQDPTGDSRGILPAGRRCQMNLYYWLNQLPATGPGIPPPRFAVYRLTPNEEDSLSWTSLPRPAEIPLATWNSPAFQNALKENLGTSWKEYQENLAALATRLALRGWDVRSVSDLFRFAVRDAYGRPASAVSGLALLGSSQQPLEGKTVVALPPTGTTVLTSTTTAPDGFYSLDWLESGKNYRIRVSGYSPDVPVTLPAAGDKIGFDLALTAGGTTTPGGCNNCNENDLPNLPVLPPEGLFSELGGADLNVRTAQDPNTKDGPAGQGGDAHIVGKEEMVYTIHFENVEKGTAKVVEVVDLLNPNVEFVRFVGCQIIRGGNTVSLGIEPPSSLVGLPGVYEEFVTTNNSDSISLECAFNFSDGRDRVRWLLSDVDLALGDSAAVSVAVQPIAAIQDGTVVDNRASILFNPYPGVEQVPMETVPPWINTIRFLPPEVPTYLAPKDGSSVDSRVSFSWNAARAQKYQIVVRDSANKTVIDEEVVQSGCVKSFLKGNEYHWQVRANNSYAGWSSWGPLWSFKTLPRFTRGNAQDDDALVDISDAIYILSFLFTGGPAPNCLKSADSDDSGLVDISDAINLLGFLFLGKSAPPAPFPGCGFDPTPDLLTCESPAPCK